MIGPAEQIRVGENAALRAQKIRVTPIARGELLDVVRGHRVQQSSAVLARCFDLGARREIEPRRSVTQRLVSCRGRYRDIHRSTAEIAITIRPDTAIPVSQRLRFARSAFGIVYRIATAKM